MIDLLSPQAFIFDLDGTLVDSEKFHVEAFAAAMLEVAGYELTEQDIRDFKGNTSRDLGNELSRRHGWEPVGDRVARRKAELLLGIFRTEPFPGAVEFIRRWQGRKRLAVASNSPRDFVERVLRDLDLMECAEVVCTVNDVTRRKPDPEMLDLVLRRMGLTAAEALVFEDSPPGVQAALAAGCPVVVVDTPAGIDAGEPPPGLPVATWAELLAASPSPQSGEAPC